MKQIYEFAPIILFFIAYHNAQFIIENTPVGNWLDPDQTEIVSATMIATGIAIIASIIQVLGHWIKNHQFNRTHIISLVLISVLGGITIALGDPLFIQWKPTVLNWVLAAAFFASQFIGKKSLIKRMMGEQINLPDPVWLKLNLSWVAFFLLSGFANLYAAFYYATDLDEKARMDIWVNFKLFGLIGMTFVFAIAQALYLSKYIQKQT